jgi:hypothetical protein
MIVLLRISDWSRRHPRARDSEDLVVEELSE